MSPLALAAAATLLASAQGPPVIIELAALPLGSGQAVSLRVEPALAGLEVAQHGSIVELSVQGVAPATLQAPAPVGPVEEIQMLREGTSLRLRVRVTPGTSAELSRSADTLTLALQHATEAAPVIGASQPSVEQLFPLLFPQGYSDPAASQASIDRDEAPEDGLRVGFITLRPGLSISYVDAEATFLETPEPTQTRYFQITPRLDASAAVRVGSGLLTAHYEPSVRRGSDFEQINRTTHVAEAALDMPLTPVSQFDARYRYVRGTLEAREVDPGGEFFFGLGRFTRHGVTAGLDVETGSRTAIDLRGYYDDVGFDDRRVGFFSHQRYGAEAGLGYEAGPTQRTSLGYAYDAVPEPEDRSIALSRAHSVFGQLDADLGPLTTGRLRVGYRRQTNANISGVGGTWNGLTLSGQVRREFSPASWAQLGVGRTTYPSNFDRNGFYVGSSLDGRLQLPLPLAFALTGGVAWQWNDYEVIFSEIGEPRADRVFGWTLGVARPLTGWAFLRADYRRDQRRSNVDAFDIDTDALIIQLGVGLFGVPR